MTIDEAIKHCEEVADTPCFTDEEARCYSEHRQLAEWLKELKAYKEKETCETCGHYKAYQHGADITTMDDECGGCCSWNSKWIPNTCGDAISRKHLLEEIAMLKKSPWFNENTYGSKVIRKEAVEIVEDVCIKREPSVTPQQKTGRWIIKDGKEQGYDIAGVKTWYIQIMCDKCGFIKTAIEGHIGEYKFCPKCGQPKM